MSVERFPGLFGRTVKAGCVAGALVVVSVSGVQADIVDQSYGNAEGCNLAMGRTIANPSYALLQPGGQVAYYDRACTIPIINDLPVGQTIEFEAACLGFDGSTDITLRLERNPETGGFIMYDTEFGLQDFLSACQ